MRPKKILVTGGAGFIGMNLLDALQNHDLYVYDTFQTADMNDRETEAIKMVMERATFVKYVREVEPDIILHLGMSSSSPMYIEKKSCITGSIATTLLVLQEAKKLMIPVVYASSSSLYNGNVPPFVESMPVYITDFYTETRLMVERLMKLYSNLYDIKTVGLRLFSVYGKYDVYKGQYANMITQFIEDGKAQDAPIVFGDGTQTRDFTHVDDVVHAFKLAMMWAKHKRTDIFNIGTGKETSFNDILGMLYPTIGKGMVTKYVENPIKNYVQRTCADTTYAERVLGFTANISLKEGIDKYD